MLKPSDIATRLASTSPADLDQRMRLEADFDAAIERATTSGVWPAVVSSDRDGALTHNVDVTIERFRAVGWNVELGGSGVRAVISKPGT